MLHVMLALVLSPSGQSVCTHILHAIPSSLSFLTDNIRIERIWEEVQAQGSWHIDAADSIHGPSIPIPTNPTPASIQGQGRDEGYQSDN